MPGDLTPIQRQRIYALLDRLMSRRFPFEVSYDDADFGVIVLAKNNLGGINYIGVDAEGDSILSVSTATRDHNSRVFFDTDITPEHLDVFCNLFEAPLPIPS